MFFKSPVPKLTTLINTGVILGWLGMTIIFILQATNRDYNHVEFIAYLLPALGIVSTIIYAVLMTLILRREQVSVFQDHFHRLVIITVLAFISNIATIIYLPVYNQWHNPDYAPFIIFLVIAVLTGITASVLEALLYVKRIKIEAIAKKKAEADAKAKEQQAQLTQPKPSSAIKMPTIDDLDLDDEPKS